MDFGLVLFYCLFFAATFSVAVEPGPVQIRLARETILHGRVNGFAMNLGTQFANLPTLMVVVFGLSYLIDFWSGALEALRWIGVAYLVWSAISLVRRKTARDAASSADDNPPVSCESRSFFASFRSGYALQVFNPIPWGFFPAYLPLWIRPELEVSASLQLFALATMLLVVFLLSDSVFVFLVARLKRNFAGKMLLSRIFKWLGATWLGILAVRLASDRN